MPCCNTQDDLETMTSLPRATTQQPTCDLSRLYDAFSAATMQHSPFHSERRQGGLSSPRHRPAPFACSSAWFGRPRPDADVATSSLPAVSVASPPFLAVVPAFLVTTTGRRYLRRGLAPWPR